MSRFRIRAHGVDTPCDSSEALRSTLVSEFPGQSVAIHYENQATGMTRVLFVDVVDEEIRASHGAQACVDLDELEEVAGGRSTDPATPSPGM